MRRAGSPALVALLLTGCGGGPVFDPPVTIENCGGTARFAGSVEATSR